MHSFTHDTGWNEWTASRFDSFTLGERRAWMQSRAGSDALAKINKTGCVRINVTMRHFNVIFVTVEKQ